MLVLQPRTGFAMAVLTNHSPNGLRVIQAALDAAGLTGPEPQPIAGAPVDEYAGVYESPGSRLTLTPDGDRLRIDPEDLGGFPSPDSPPGPKPPEFAAFFYTPERWFVPEGPFQGTRGHFIRGADGDVAWLRMGGRLYRNQLRSRSSA
jgi:hypothetical protein